MRVKLVIVGNGPEKENLKSIVNKLKFNKKDVKFFNHINYISEFLRKIDVFCMNTKFEGFRFGNARGNVFSYSNNCTKYKRLPEVVKNKSNGILVKPNNILDYSEAMKTMTKKELRTKYSINSKQILEKNLI